VSFVVVLSDGGRIMGECVKSMKGMGIYVMPKILCTGIIMHACMHAWVKPRQVSSLEGGVTRIIATEDSFRIFLESNGTLSPMAVMESKICSEDYLKLVVRD
jgi:hypothetical protein